MNKTETKLFKDLLALPTAPYYEGAVDAYIRAFAKKRNLSVKTDKYGNLIVRYTNGKKPKPVALAGHMDHPGLEVLEANGRDLTARWLGGCDPKHFPGGRVILYSGGEEISGKANSTLSPEKIFSIRAARSLPETEGVFGHWQLKPVVFNGDLIHTKGADNLASCAAILATLDRLRRKKTNADLWGVFTRAEEVGLQGAAGIVDAKTVPKRVPLVVLETSKELPGAEIGNGPVIRVGDRMSIFDPKVEYTIHTLARELQEKNKTFKFQRQLMSGGVCEATLYVLHGFTVGALAFPLGNYHNQGKRWPAEEIISASDASGMIDICTALALNPPSGETRTPIKKRFESSFKSRKKRLLQK